MSSRPSVSRRLPRKPAASTPARSRAAHGAVLVVLGVAGSLGAAVAPHVTVGPDRCAGDVWSRPIPLAPGSIMEHIARLPSVAPAGAGFVVAGSRMPPAEVPGLDVPWDRSLPVFIAYRVSGTGTISSIPAPPAPSVVMLPRIGVDGDGALHVVWFDPDSTDPAVYPRDPFVPGTLREVQYAAGHWSAVRNVAHAPTIGWDDIRGSDLVAAGGDLLFAFGASRTDRDGHGNMFVGRITGDSLSAGEVTPGGWHPPNYVAVATTARGVLVVLWVGSTDRGGPAVPRLRRSTDGGRTWSDVAVLPNDPPLTAYSVRLVATPDSALHAVWTAAPDPVSLATIVRHTASADDGQTWTPVRDMEPGGDVYEPRVVADRCSTVHLFYPDTRESLVAPVIAHLAYGPDGWRRATATPSVGLSFDAAAARLADSAIVLVWTQPDSATHRMFEDLHLTDFRPAVIPSLPQLPRAQTVYSILAAPDRSGSAPP